MHLTRANILALGLAVSGCVALSGKNQSPKGPSNQTALFGEAMSQATTGNLDLFGTPAYFNRGEPVPAGRYRVSYVDGCMKYNPSQGWTVNATDETGCCAWWVVGETIADKRVVAPGTIGHTVGLGAFQGFEECVNANQAVPAKVFEHPGGRVGVWLQDSPYSDNQPGEKGRNPNWRLERAPD